LEVREREEAGSKDGSKRREMKVGEGGGEEREGDE
jgi:hypothetical protein